MLAPRDTGCLAVTTCRTGRSADRREPCRSVWHTLSDEEPQKEHAQSCRYGGTPVGTRAVYAAPVKSVLRAPVAKAVAGLATVKRNRFIALDGAVKSVNREMEAWAMDLAGLKGYVTSLAACPMAPRHCGLRHRQLPPAPHYRVRRSRRQQVDRGTDGWSTR